MDVHNGGRILWQVETTVPSGGASLATAGGILFDGERNGFFRAYDSSTGDLLWSFQTGSAVEGHPISYSAGGRQFVVIGSGSGMFAFAVPTQ
jgi:glucose dehydrogenase